MPPLLTLLLPPTPTRLRTPPAQLIYFWAIFAGAAARPGERVREMLAVHALMLATSAGHLALMWRAPGPYRRRRARWQAAMRAVRMGVHVFISHHADTRAWWLSRLLHPGTPPGRALAVAAAGVGVTHFVISTLNPCPVALQPLFTAAGLSVWAAGLLPVSARVWSAPAVAPVAADACWWLQAGARVADAASLSLFGCVGGWARLAGWAGRTGALSRAGVARSVGSWLPPAPPRPTRAKCHPSTPPCSALPLPSPQHPCRDARGHRAPPGRAAAGALRLPAAGGDDRTLPRNRSGSADSPVVDLRAQRQGRFSSGARLRPRAALAAPAPAPRARRGGCGGGRGARAGRGRGGRAAALVGGGGRRPGHQPRLPGLPVTAPARALS
jgi:hypothetical protein